MIQCKAAIAPTGSAVKASGLADECVSVNLELYGINVNDLLAMRGKVLNLSLVAVGEEMEPAVKMRLAKA